MIATNPEMFSKYFMYLALHRDFRNDPEKTIRKHPKCQLPYFFDVYNLGEAVRDKPHPAKHNRADKMMNELSTVPLTMSALEIAGLAGKRHDHVLRDADRMLVELGEDNAPKFGAVYSDAKGEKRRCMNLPKRECLILVSGCSVAYINPERNFASKPIASSFSKAPAIESDSGHAISFCWRQAGSRCERQMDGKD
jgi:hypothetical protein